MTRPRGTTVRVWCDPNPARLRPWGVFWNVYRERFVGRPRQRSKWYATEAEAEEVKRRVLAALAAADVDTTAGVVTGTTYDKPGTVGAFAPLWLAHVAARREVATHSSYASLMANHILPALGNLLLTDKTFTPKPILAFYEALQQRGMVLGSRRRVHGCLSAMATYAVTQEWIRVNPCLKLGRELRVKGEESGVRPNPFTTDEVRRIFDRLAAAEPDWLAYFQFLHDAGPRVGEIAALPWTAIDLAAKTAHIARSYCPRAAAEKDTKTHEKRIIDLTDTIVDQLLAWRPLQRREALRRGIKQPVHVFTNRRGTPRRQDGNMRRVFDRVMAACGIEGHTPHDFRDTFATSHLQEDWDRKLGWVSKQLGHSTPLTTSRHYYGYRPTLASKGFANEIRGRR